MVTEIDDDAQDNQHYRLPKPNLSLLLHTPVNNNERISFFNLCETSCRAVTHHSDKL